MEDLVRWLSARLDEDAERAHASEVKGDDPEWWVSPVPSSRDLYAVRGERDHVAIARVQRLYDTDGRTVVLDGRAVAEHIAAHDPARVLREIDSRRQLLAEYVLADAEGKYPDWPGGYASGLEYAVQLAAADYADRPGYDPEWAPRSQWGPPATP